MLNNEKISINGEYGGPNFYSPNAKTKIEKLFRFTGELPQIRHSCITIKLTIMSFQKTTPAEILQQMSKVPNDTIWGKSIHQFLAEKNKTDDEIFKAASSIKEHIIDNSPGMRKILGNAYTFFLTLKID